jgi:hypothetical protein
MARQARAGRRGGGNPGPAVRRWHGYLGAFIAPSVLFFAATGALQLFSLHEAWGDYRPAPVIEKLGMLHKDQVFQAKPKRVRPPADLNAAPQPAKRAPRPATLALKGFFLVVAAGLIVSTLLGLWMALSSGMQRARLWLLFLAGAAIPLALLLA